MEQKQAGKPRAERIVRPLGEPGWPATTHKQSPSAVAEGVPQAGEVTEGKKGAAGRLERLGLRSHLYLALHGWVQDTGFPVKAAPGVQVVGTQLHAVTIHRSQAFPESMQYMPWPQEGTSLSQHLGG